MTIKRAQFFCGLGLPKTGTTWLAEYLRSHPEVFVPLIKELQVFNRKYRNDLYHWMDALLDQNRTNLEAKLKNNPSNKDRLEELKNLLNETLAIPYYSNMSKMMDSYRQLFLERISENHLVFGEFSTTYCLLPLSGLQALDQAFPDTKYIIILRDPVDRFWSHVKHQAGVKKNFDPVDCLSKNLEDSELLEISNYRTVIGNIQKLIPTDRIHIALYEELFLQRDEGALAEITNFLGISYRTADLHTVVYPGEIFAMPEQLKAEARLRFKDSYAFGTELFGRTPAGWSPE